VLCRLKKKKRKQKYAPQIPTVLDWMGFEKHPQAQIVFLALVARKMTKKVWWDVFYAEILECIILLKYIISGICRSLPICIALWFYELHSTAPQGMNEIILQILNKTFMRTTQKWPAEIQGAFACLCQLSWDMTTVLPLAFPPLHFNSDGWFRASNSV
jgi:hypothetical protein